MVDVESKPQSDIIVPADTEQSLPEWLRYVAATAMTAVATVVAIAVDTSVSIPNLSLLFVIPVIVAGISLGLGPSLCSATLGALAFNFFLTEPRYSLAVDDPANVWAIGLLFTVGLIVSGVAFASNRRATEVSSLRRQAAILGKYSQDVAAAGSPDAATARTTQALADLFRIPALVILFAEGKVASIKRSGGSDPKDPDLEAARACAATGTVSRGGVYPNPEAQFDFWPVRTTGGQTAVVGLAFDPDERPAAPDMQVAVVVSVLGLVLERQHSR